MKKKCAECKNEFELENFPKDKTSKSGYRSYCFSCNRIRGNKVTMNRKDKRRLENIRDREKRSLYNKIYEKKNRNKINLIHYNLLKDPKNKIIHNTRVRINKALKFNYKSLSSINLLGCSIEEYKQYLESKFTPEMSWKNYGSYWEIDHIQPCSSFDLIKEEEQKKCFHYLNTQPLTVEENRIKSDKI